MRHQLGAGVALLLVVALGVVLLSAFQDGPRSADRAAQAGTPGGSAAAPAPASHGPAPARSRGTVTLAFAGDIHFEGAFTDVPEQGRSTLGRMSRDLRSADVAVVNLESALASPGTPARKELEDAGNRYWFRSDAAALDVLDRSGVDVVSIANNHGADYGLRGIRESVRIAEQSPVAVVGVGRTSRRAFAPHRVTVRGTTVAVHAADASARESAEPTWAVGPVSGPGIASARSPLAPQLLDAVRASATRGDVVVVYLHWGEEYGVCPTADQRQLARNLADAGADVIVGTHAHVLLGAGMLDSAYVSYGLGNFYWYHGNQAETGVLRLTVRAGEGGEGGGEVVGDEWRPGLIPPQGGGPQPVTGRDGEQDVQDWRALRGCTGLAPGPGPVGATADTGSGRDLPPFASQVRPVGPALRARMTGSSHDPATCPVPWRDLRLLRLSYVGFDGRAHPGAMVVHADVARDVVGVFASLYRARFPLQRMRLVDAYDGDDDRSMAANNTSGYNCRTVAGQSALSDHAYGRAIDINPVQNPYVLSDGVLPPAGRRFVDVDRSAGARAVPGVIRRGDVVTRAFARAGWTWGGVWSSPDFQHFSAS